MTRHVDPDARLAAVQQAMDSAAAALAEVDQARWPGWVIYLLEQLDREGNPEYVLQMALLRDAISKRIDSGAW